MQDGVTGLRLERLTRSVRDIRKRAREQDMERAWRAAFEFGRVIPDDLV